MILRGTHSEHEDLGNGRNRLTIYLKPIAYWDIGGQLRRITNVLKATGDPAFPIGVDELVQFRVRDKLAGSSPVLHFGKGKAHVHITPLDTNNTMGVVNGQSITFPEAWNNADLKLTIAGHRLQKEVFLKSGHPQTFSFRIDDHAGLNLDTLETEDFRILQPVLRDPYGLLNMPLSWIVSEQGGKIILTVTLPPGGHAGKVLDPTLTLQPDAAAGLDTWLRSNNSNACYGTHDELRIGEDKVDVDIARGLLKFSGLSGTPANAIVSSSVLSLWLIQPGNSAAANNRTVRVFRQLRAWVEGVTEDPSTAGATWDNYECSGPTAWATAGGFGAADCEQTDIGSHGMLTTDLVDTEHTFTLTAAEVQEWISGALTNNGMLLKADTEADDLYRFHASDSIDAGYRPKLVTEYTIPPIAKAISTGLVLSATTARKTERGIATGISLLASVERAISKGLSATLVTSGVVGRTIAKAVTSDIVLTATIPSHPFIKAISAGISLSATVGRTINKGLSSTIVTAVSVGRTIGKGIASGVVLTATVPFRPFIKAIVAGIALSVSVGRTIGKGISTGVALSASVGRTTKKGIASGVALSVSVGRTIKKGIAATIVLTSSVVRKIHKITEGGIELSATVGRLIKKHIQAGITLIGQVPRTVYDMAWEMNKPIRKILGRVAITYSDPFFSAGLTAEASETGRYTYPAQTADNVTEGAYKWFSLHRNVLDGTFHPLPGNQEYSVGWWSATLCNAVTAIFAAPPVLTINHSARSVESLLVMGDDKLDEYPVDFWVRLYSEGGVPEYEFHETANATVEWTKDIATETNIVRHELTINKWSRVSSVAKIAQFFTMLEETYNSEDGDLFSIRVLEEREFDEPTIPQGNISTNEITVRLNNIDDLFSAGNITSHLHGMLLNNRAIRAWLGCDLRSGERIWFPLGTFYSRNWSTPEGEPWAEVTGMDMLDRLKQTEFSVSEIYTDVTLHDLAITVMTDAGLTDADWVIDPVLDTADYTIPYAWFARMSHRAALKLIAAAALGQVYCNRDGKIVVAVYIPPTRMPASDFHYTEGNFFEVDHPLRWSEMVNYVQAQAVPRVALAEDDICLDTETFTVPGSGTVTKTHFFDITPCVEVVDPLEFVNDINGAGHVILDSMTIYAWGVSATYSNTDPGDETVTSVTIRGKRLEVQGGRAVVAQDETSIAANGKQTLATPITSEFWQSETQAQAAADSLLASYKDPRRDVVMRARGNIALLLGDRVVAPDFRDDVSAEFGLMRQDIDYDGAMEVAVVAQRIPDGVVTHYKHLSAGIDLQSTIGKTKKTHWKHLTTGIDLQSTIGWKVSKGVSAGITVAGTITKFASSQRRALSAGIALAGTVGRVWPVAVGAAATDRAAGGGLNQTFIQVDNPANNPGTLTTIKLWADEVTQPEGWKVGAFYGSGTNYTSRDHAALPTVSAGYNEFSGLSINVEKGDFIGIYLPGGAKVDLGAPPTDFYYAPGDKFGAGLQTYTLNTDYGISLNGEGTGNN